MEEANKNDEKTRAEIYLNPETKRFKEGNPGGGRPKGSKSIKDAVRKYLENNPEDFAEYVKHFTQDNRELSWQMLEGRPPQKIQGDKDAPLVIQISKEVAEKNDINTGTENNSKEQT